LNHAIVIECEEVKEFIDLTYPHASTPDVIRQVKDFDLTIEARNFADACRMTVSVSLKNRDRLIEKIQLLAVTGTNVTFSQ
jgi:hypothetical protein